VPRLGPDTLWVRFHRRVRQTLRAEQKLGDPGWLEVLFEGVAVAVVVLVAVFIGIPFLVALLDLLLLLVLALLGLAARVLFRRPWIITAHAGDGAVQSWRVTGWSASRERRDQIEQRLRAGLDLDDEGLRS
jgi:hypothetical protein